MLDPTCGVTFFDRFPLVKTTTVGHRDVFSHRFSCAQDDSGSGEIGQRGWLCDECQAEHSLQVSAVRLHNRRQSHGITIMAQSVGYCYFEESLSSSDHNAGRTTMFSARQKGRWCVTWTMRTATMRTATSATISIGRRDDELREKRSAAVVRRGSNDNNDDDRRCQSILIPPRERERAVPSSSSGAPQSPMVVRSPDLCIVSYS